jgi:histone H2A
LIELSYIRKSILFFQIKTYIKMSSKRKQSKSSIKKITESEEELKDSKSITKEDCALLNDFKNLSTDNVHYVKISNGRLEKVIHSISDNIQSNIFDEQIDLLVDKIDDEPDDDYLQNFVSDRFDDNENEDDENPEENILGNYAKKQIENTSSTSENIYHRGLFASDIYKILKQVHPDAEISKLAFAVVNDMIVDILKRFIVEFKIISSFGVSGKKVTESTYNPISLKESCINSVLKNPQSCKTDRQLPLELQEELGNKFISKRTLESESLIRVCKMIIPGELAKHSISEVIKFSKKILDDESSFQSGLQFDVLKTAKFCYENEVYNLSTVSVVGLSAIMEYLIAEILELAGNATRDSRREQIIPKDIMLAIRADEELDELFKNIIISKSGVVPHIHKFLLGKRKMDRSEGTTFGVESQMEDEEFSLYSLKFEESQLLFPIDLNYYCGSIIEEDDNSDYCCSIYEGQCKKCKKTTKAIADMSLKGKLSKCSKELKKLKTFTDSSIDQFINDMNCYHEGVGKISMKTADDISLMEIREEQKKTNLIIPSDNFALLVKDIMHDQIDEKSVNSITQNAIEALQYASENYLVELFEKATKLNVHRGSQFLEPIDIAYCKRNE